MRVKMRYMIASLCLLFSLPLAASSPSLATSAPARCGVTIFPRTGGYVATPTLHGPGLLLDGSGASSSPDSTLSWLHQTLVGNATARGGNLVVLEASGTNDADQRFYVTGNLASVQTVLIPPCATRAQYDALVPLVDGADAVYFAGGDQANYVRWKGSGLIAAVRRVYARNGVVGGGSAGLAIQGAVAFDSVAADKRHAEITTAGTVRNPLDPRISFTTGLFDWPSLEDTITDSHFVARDRFGRTAVFLARIFHDGLNPPAEYIYALGIDAGSAVVVGPDGTAMVLNNDGAHGAYLIRTGAPAALAPGKPLQYTVEVMHVAHDAEKFDLLDKQTPEPWYSVTIDGSKPPYYTPDPYGQ